MRREFSNGINESNCEIRAERSKPRSNLKTATNSITIYQPASNSQFLVHLPVNATPE